MAPRLPPSEWLSSLPLDVWEALDVIMGAGPAMLIQLILLLLAVVLTAAALILTGLACVAFLSTTSGAQYEASDLALGAFVALIGAALVGVGPAVLQALGMRTAKYFNAIEIFSGTIIVLT